jgi:hypothetical protein
MADAPGRVTYAAQGRDAYAQCDTAKYVLDFSAAKCEGMTMIAAMTTQ